MKHQFSISGPTTCLLISALFAVACGSKNNEDVKADAVLDSLKELTKSEEQLSGLLEEAEAEDRIPRTLTPGGEIHWANMDFDWTEGFFPGSCWYLYEFSKDEKWRKAAEKFQEKFESHKNLTTNHDLGFVFNCSYGNGYRLTSDESFKEVLITAADSLLTRFDPKVGCIKSWDTDKGWQAERNWEFPVIIDNMMNLELLFEVSKYTGDPRYAKIAMTHADTTRKNHFREDSSSYHVVDYDPMTGKVRRRQTAQGLADESAWARGQAWGLYGYTVCYRYTKEPRYLEQALKIADFIVNSPKVPADKIPYWDYDAPKGAPRDASAAAITASALFELQKFLGGKYLGYAKDVLKSLSSETYALKPGEAHSFLLKHSVGSIPHNSEIDVPLNYADYYYLEALLRYRALK